MTGPVTTTTGGINVVTKINIAQAAKEHEAVSLASPKSLTSHQWSNESLQLLIVSNTLHLLYGLYGIGSVIPAFLNSDNLILQASHSPQLTPSSSKL